MLDSIKIALQHLPPKRWLTELVAYLTFNAFFVRPLRKYTRPMDADPAVIVLLADGIISQLGPIDGEQIFQTKRQHYSLEALLVGNEPMIAHFLDGSFVTTYLATRDYHRMYMPCNGVLRKMLYVLAELFLVNLLTAINIHNLFARNELVIGLCDTDFGSMAQILMGPTIIGSIDIVLAVTVTPRRQGIIKHWRLPPRRWYS